MLSIYICLFLLFTKHLIMDWYLQTNEMIKYKGELFNLVGMSHSALHGIGTFIAVIWFTSFNDAIFLGIGDFIIHYVVDYVKMKYGCQDIKNKKFWNHIGLDQYIHYLTYLAIVYIIFQGV